MEELNDFTVHEIDRAVKIALALMRKENANYKETRSEEHNANACALSQVAELLRDYRDIRIMRRQYP